MAADPLTLAEVRDLVSFTARCGLSSAGYYVAVSRLAATVERLALYIGMDCSCDTADQDWTRHPATCEWRQWMEEGAMGDDRIADEEIDGLRRSAARMVAHAERQTERARDALDAARQEAEERPQTAQLRDELLAWVDERVEAEVTHRPDVNVHKRTLAETWAQVRRRLELIPDFTATPAPRPGREEIADRLSSLAPIIGPIVADAAQAYLRDREEAGDDASLTFYMYTAIDRVLAALEGRG